MELESESYRTLFDLTLETLEDFRTIQSSPAYDPNVKNFIGTMRLDLRFFKMLLWGLDYCQESQVVGDSRSVLSTMGRELIQIASVIRVQRTKTHKAEEKLFTYDNWEQANSDFEKRIQYFKPHVKEICILLLGGAAVRPYEPCPDDHKEEEFSIEYGRQTAFFIHFVLQNLVALRFSKVDLLPPVKHQIACITRKFKGFGNFAYPVTRHWITSFKNLGELMSCARTWATHISCLACLYWIDGMDESLASTMGTTLSDLTHKTMPYTPGLVASCLESTLIPQLLASYIDFILEDLVIPVKDDIETLREGLIFLLSFVTDPTHEEDSQDREKILGQIYAIFNEFQSLICSINVDEMNEGIYQTMLSDFLQKIARVKAQVGQLYAVTWHASKFDTPRINAIGFLDSLLRKLKKMLERKVSFIATVKNGIQIVHEELASLKPFLQNNMEVQHEQEELKDLWTRIVHLMYYAAYGTNLCPATSSSIWYPIICLPSVIEEINLIKNEVKEIKDDRMHKRKMPSAPMESSNRLLPQDETSKIEGPFIGFKDDVTSIIVHLMRGEDLKIICISGMPGQGKTTLARKIYNDLQIQCHFHKIAWCYVSKACTSRELLIKILHNFDKSLGPEIQDLAQFLWRSLKGRRYLIVMDDIWDVDLWRQVQISFPNDSNGSRILFTSRNHNLASEADPNSISHPLHLFSPEESWELMNAKLNFGDHCKPEILEIGKQIAICCKGLPLAVAITASILGRTEKELDLWLQVAENVESHLASEGFLDIIELSYKYLPDHLKPCFLYFGAFPRGESIPAKKLKLLWIAEGFIKENEMLSPENLAKAYLDILVFRSLIVVTERSSSGKIKRCNVHDLLYDLCLKKIAEENFLYLASKSSIFVDECYSSPQQKYSNHRLCIGSSNPFMEPRSILSRKEFPTSQVHSLLWFRDHLNDLFFGPHYSYRFSLDVDEVSWFLKEF